jgi:hypothetical protein
LSYATESTKNIAAAPRNVVARLEPEMFLVSMLRNLLFVNDITDLGQYLQPGLRRGGTNAC